MDRLKYGMENMNELRKKFTYRTVLGLGEFDWVVIKSMLLSAYGEKLNKARREEYRISILKEDGYDMSWAEFQLRDEKVRIAAWKQAMNLLMENVEDESAGFGWGKNYGDRDSRNLYEGEYAR